MRPAAGQKFKEAAAKAAAAIGLRARRRVSLRAGHGRTRTAESNLQGVGQSRNNKHARKKHR